MTEIRTGLTRANIRYYEKEGLLSPQRQANGYRDYTEENIQTLLRVKLLRELGISLEEIRQLQQNETALNRLLERRMREIRTEEANLQAARAVCDEMRHDDITYAQLDAERYLQSLQRQRQGSIARPADLSGDRTPYEPHPWRRFFARDLDQVLFSLFLFFLWYTVIDQFYAGQVSSFLSWFISLVLTLLLEPLLLHLFGTTPGKWIMGITVLDPDGGKLSLSAAFSRTVTCLWRGQGMEIPIYAIYRRYKSYAADMAGEMLPWEENSDLSFRDTRPIRAAALAAAYVVSLLLILLVALESRLPPNRGSLTPAELAENYNWYARQLEMDERWILEETGQWREAPADPSSVVISLFSNDDTAPAPFIYTLEDGIVTGITQETDISYDPASDPDRTPGNSVLLSSQAVQIRLMSLAVTGAQLPWDLLWLNTMAAEAFFDPFLSTEDGTISQSEAIGNLTFSCTQRSSGYLVQDTYMIPGDQGISNFHRVFSIQINP